MTIASPTPEEKRFRALLAQLAGLKPEISQDAILKLIEAKKQNVGGGYLTDQGALFLVASDLGVALNYNHPTTIQLADVSAEMTALSVDCRVLSYGPPRAFVRKNDAKQGVLARMIVYDKSGVSVVSLWDTKASSLLASSGEFAPGELVRISNAYSRAGFNGAITINLGERGTIERIQAKQGQKEPGSIPSIAGEVEIPEIPTRAVPPELITEPASFLVVRGKVKGRSRETSFNRSDGTAGKLVTFFLNGGDGNQEGDHTTDTRVLLWDNANPAFLNLREEEQVTLLNVKSKLPGPNGPSAGMMELHGDETTGMLEYWQETLHWMKKQGATSAPMTGGPLDASKNSQKDPVPFVARILSMGQKTADPSSFVRCLLVDSQKRKFSVSFSKESAQDIQSFKMDDLIICKPDTIDYLTLRANCSKKGAATRVNAKRPDIPEASTLFRNIENLEEGTTVSLEVMSLSEAASREVQTKDGLVRRTELSVGDATGEIKLFAWRELSKLLDKLSAGTRIWLRAVEVQSHEGRKFLVLKNFSRVELEPDSSLAKGASIAVSPAG